MKRIVSIEHSPYIVGLCSRGRESYIGAHRGFWRYYQPQNVPLVLIVRWCEYDNYMDQLIKYSLDDYVMVLRVTDDAGIAEKRQRLLDFAIEQNKTHLFMADDDIRLGRRIGSTPQFKEGLVDTLPELIKKCMDVCGYIYPLVHPRIRMHANTAKYRYEKNCPAIRFTCWYVGILVRESIRADGLGEPFMFDRYMQNALLSKGYKSIALGQFCVDDGGTGTKGGCAETRTTKLQSSSAVKLTSLFPNVTLRKKNGGYDCTQHLKRYLRKGEQIYVEKQTMERNYGKL